MRRLVFLLALILIVSCEPKEEISHGDLKTVTATTTEAVFDAPGGLAKIAFSITDETLILNTSTDSEDYQIWVENEEGYNPLFFHIEAINRIQKGDYEITLRDDNIAPLYSQNVKIGIAFGQIFYSQDINIHTANCDRVPVKTGLPLVYINTDEQAEIVSKDDWVEATITIDDLTSDDVIVNSMPMSIKGRGNATWGYPKKPFTFKLSKKTSLFGMPAHKRWVLLANYIDRTLMRNIIGLKAASLTSLAWTPRYQPVEVILNGTHIGSYLLTEQIRVDANRVDISEENGFLFELDQYYDNPVQWIDPHGIMRTKFGTEAGIPFAIKSPEEDVITPELLDKAKHLIYDAAESTINGDLSMIDVQSFADYWIVFELMGNTEINNPSSVYMFVDEGGKLTAGPCWDFDWGTLSYRIHENEKTQILNRYAIWYEWLMKNPEFMAVLQNRWTVLRPVFESLVPYFDEMKQTLHLSAQLDRAIWGESMLYLHK